MTTPKDRQPIVSEFADDPDMAELVGSFVRELPARVEALRLAFQQRDTAAARRLAHQLKGAGGGYGFPMLSDAAGVLEARLTDITDDCLAQLQRELTELSDLCARVAPR